MFPIILSSVSVTFIETLPEYFTGVYSSFTDAGMYIVVKMVRFWC